MADKWDYMSESIHYAATETNSYDKAANAEKFLMNRLNELGRDGWEVMQIQGGYQSPGVNYIWLVRFKRRMT